jgi:hypothetical protein
LTDCYAISRRLNVCKHTVRGGLILSCLAVLLTVGMVVTLAGCGESDSSIKLSDSVPSGFTSSEVDGIRLAYPDSWDVEESPGSLSVDSLDGSVSLSMLHVRASNIEDIPGLEIYKGDDLDHDVDSAAESSHAKGTEIKRIAKGADGPATIYRYELSGETEAGNEIHGYWQYTFSGNSYYMVMVTSSKETFDSHRDQMLGILNSQKLSDPEAPQKVLD